MGDLVGRTLGHYRIVEKIGAGGMGEVYRAHDELLDRDVAIKVVPEDLAADPERLARFEREARAAAALDHPNVLAVHELGIHEGRPFMVTELLAGQSFRDLISARALTARSVVEVAVQVANGLAAAHERGIVHRDLKPENLFLTTDGIAKILDFGLARLVVPDASGSTLAEAATEALVSSEGVVVGTTAYMSPEQARGQAVGAASDIFSFGVLLYEMLTGLSPFRRVTPADTVSAVLSEDPPPVSANTSRINAAFDGIVRRCLQKRPEDRFQSARDLGFALQAILEAPDRRPRIQTGPRIGYRPLTIIPVVLAAALAFALLHLGYRTLLEQGVAKPASAATPPRLVVLPFSNLGPPDQSYFADGVTEEITNRLAAVSGLRVISRTTAMGYAGTTKSAAKIGEELKVGYLLEGAVRWSGGTGASSRVRITPRLVRVSDDTEMWASSYEHDLDDIFRIQSTVAKQVAEQLGVELRPAERAAVEDRPTHNIDAYQAYLRGRFLDSQPHFSVDIGQRVVSSFERAVELDPDFALAWAELAKAHGKLHFFSADLSAQRLDAAAGAAGRARSLEPTSARVRLALAAYHLRAERDVASAKIELDAAEELLRSDPELLLTRALMYELEGDFASALDALIRAKELSPGDPSIPMDMALDLWMLHRHSEAIAAADRALELAPDSVWPSLGKALVSWSAGNLADARRALEALPDVEHEWIPWMWFWQEIYEGRPDAALDWLEKVPGEVIWTKMWASPVALLAATAHEHAGRPEQAQTEWRRARDVLVRQLAESPEDPRLHTSLGIVEAALGRREDALAEVRRGLELLPLSKDAFYGLAEEWDLARVLTRTGDAEGAIAQLDRLLTVPSWLTVEWLEMDPTWDSLRSHPEYRAMVKRHASAGP